MMFGDQDQAEVPFIIKVNFPKEYMEIKQERVCICIQCASFALLSNIIQAIICFAIQGF